MPWFLPGFENRTLNVSPPAARAVNQSSNTAQQSQERVLDPYTTGNTYVGVVTRAGAGLYDAMVRSPGSPDLPCIIAVSQTNYYFGTCDCNIPIEGSRVLVYKPFSSVNFGVIVRTLPPADLVFPSGEQLPEAYIHMWDAEPGASAMTESAYRTIWTQDTDTKMVNAHAGRPLDLFPGNQAWINEQGVGIALFNLMAALRGSDKAKVEVSLLDDLVRVVSGYFRHINAQGEDQIYNDGGLLTREISATSYQCERSGFNDYGQALFAQDDSEGLLSQADTSAYKMSEDTVTSKKRFQLMIGYLGDIVNLFVAKPDPTQSPETSEADSKDQGLLHTHIDASGRMIVRSAAGISLQRDDIIPVPKKKHEPWDPEGDKMEPTEEGIEPWRPTEKEPFEWDEDHPYARALQMRDAHSYRNMQAVQRLHDQSTGGDGKDYYLPEESELSTPDDEYDTQGRAQEEFSKNAGRKASIDIEDDGSIIFRDAWGSELIMRGGNIILNCPGQIEERPGKSLVQLAGHDIISKARKSIDITATDGDVRVKANTNLHMVSEGREGPNSRGGGGILLESKASSEGLGYKDRTGEEVISAGIVLKAKDSRVFLEGKKVHASGRKGVLVEAFDEDGTNTGDVFISARNIYSNADKNTLITSSTGAGVLITRRQAILAGESAMLLGGNSLVLTKGAKAWIPLMEADIGSNPYQAVQPTIERIYELIQANTDWTKPFDPEARKDIEFTYRSSSEYGTTTASEVYGATDFAVYQATWAYLAGVGYDFINGTVDAWVDYEIEETYAWPGKDVYDGSSAYVKLDGEANIEDPSTGVPKARAALQNTPGNLSGKSFNEYEVMRTT